MCRAREQKNVKKTSLSALLLGLPSLAATCSAILHLPNYSSQLKEELLS